MTKTKTKTKKQAKKPELVAVLSIGTSMIDGEPCYLVHIDGELNEEISGDMTLKELVAQLLEEEPEFSTDEFNIVHKYYNSHQELESFRN